jgi:hypothetical protein
LPSPDLPGSKIEIQERSKVLSVMVPAKDEFESTRSRPELFLTEVLKVGIATVLKQVAT